jgi:putative transposase
MVAMTSRSRLIPGMRVFDELGKYIVIDLINMQEVLVESSGAQKLVKPASSLSLDLIENSTPHVELINVNRDDWEEACRIAEAIGPLVEMGKHRRTKKDISCVAKKFDCHIATVYRWLDLYEKTGLISALLRKRRSDIGKKRLAENVEKIIQSCINEIYLNDQKSTMEKVFIEVKKRCKKDNLSVPDINTVRARILAIDEVERVRAREGEKKADEKYAPIIGSFPNADYPLAVVQIDHTPMDVIVVDDVHRQPIGRPILTIAIDIFSKMIVGFYISLDAAGALATGICISRSILTKEKFLDEMDVDIEWPCWGVMRTIHTDNAKEFRGTMLGRAAKQYGINPERRPKGKPKYGGHVERAFRTYMSEIHNELPGTTFSNVKHKSEYDSEGKSVMSFDALHVWFTLFILGVYHQRPHEGNNKIPPIVQWERGLLGGGDYGLGRGIPARYHDEQRLRLDFLPYVERTVQEYGITFEGIFYWSDSIRRFIHAKALKSIKNKKLFICRYDPRNLSKIWFFDPDNEQYIDIPYKDLTRPPISLWELRAAKKIIRDDSTSSTNEELIFRTIDQMREIVDSESKKTKSARKNQQKRKNWEKSTVNTVKEKKAIEPLSINEDAVEDDMDDLEPFDIRES